jgi:twitching motility protein PilT
MQLMDLLQFAATQQASDLHVSVGTQPLLRVDGVLRTIIDAPVFDHQTLLTDLLACMPTQQREQYLAVRDVDFVCSIESLGRCRVNAFHHARGAGAVLRLIPSRIPSLRSLGLPTMLQDLIQLSHGLVIIAGPSGSGKSTTLAAILHQINTHRIAHIITLEDPIEYLHTQVQSLINQREVTRDTVSFSSGLRSALRADPDILVVGELRDLETIRLALTAAETGHLVFATLHSHSAVQAIHRLLAVFPAHEHGMVRYLLAESLQAISAQVLVKRQGGGRIAAVDLLRGTTAVKHLIRTNNMQQLQSVMQTGYAHGMMTREQHAMQLLQSHLITEETVHEINRSEVVGGLVS